MIIHNIEVSKPILKILNKELARGNEIIETSKGWSSENDLLIILKHPFGKKYLWSGLQYNFLNDPHYWKEEYTDTKNNQTLACKF